MTAPDDALATLRRLFAHTWDARAAVIHGIGRLPWDEAVAVPSPNARSVVDATLDMLETEAYWAHFVMDNAKSDPDWTWKPYDRSNVTSAERLAMHAAGIERATAERLARLTNAELARPRAAPAEGAWTAGDVLLRVATQSLVESGRLAERLTAMGASVQVPPYRPRG